MFEWLENQIKKKKQQQIRFHFKISLYCVYKDIFNHFRITRGCIIAIYWLIASNYEGHSWNSALLSSAIICTPWDSMHKKEWRWYQNLTRWMQRNFRKLKSKVGHRSILRHFEFTQLFKLIFPTSFWPTKIACKLNRFRETADKFTILTIFLQMGRLAYVLWTHNINLHKYLRIFLRLRRRFCKGHLPLKQIYINTILMKFQCWQNTTDHWIVAFYLFAIQKYRLH